MTGLLTDLYQLTMAAGYFEAGKTDEIATFELFFRRLPRYRNYVVAAGLAQVVDYLLNLQFATEEIDYLRGLPQFQRASPPASSMPAPAALHRRSFRDAGGHAHLRQRTVPDCSRAADGSADRRDISARHHRLSVADRHQGSAHRGSGRRPRGGGFRHSPRAFARSGRSGRTRILHRRLHRNQQHGNRLSLRHPGIRNGGALLGAVLRIRDGSISSGCRICWAMPPCI